MAVTGLRELQNGTSRAHFLLDWLYAALYQFTATLFIFTTRYC